MAGPDRLSSTGVDRRASARLSGISIEQHGDDDYDLEAAGISDGFRPLAAGGGGGSSGGHNRIPSQTSQHNIERRRTPPPRPSSATKPKGIDSFALRHDGAIGAGARRNSTAASNSNANAAPTRSSSVSTDMPYVTVETPYQGPTGPSHPYQSYPQESRAARTASMATASTVQAPDRPYTGPGGPQHPYGMYPQNTVPEGEVADDPASMGAIPPVGFPGLNNHYERRLGPDGEEVADIIGPDGHTEQLPPYTKYPDDAFARKAGTSRPAVEPPDVIATAPPVAPLAGAGGIGLATRNPEFASREDLNSPHSRQSIRSMTSDSSSHQVNMGALGVVNEKPELKRWQKAARRKVCGIIPVWAITLTVVIFFLFGIILGSVLAALKPKRPNFRPKFRPGGYPENVNSTTMTITPDETPITVLPPGLPSVPTGTYALPISAPSTIQNSCITNTQWSAAWTCQVPMTSYTITIKPRSAPVNGFENNEINLSLGNGSFGNYYAYGTQPPVLTQPQPLSLVTDNQEPGRGPAWFFELPYNKLVIIPEAILSPSAAKREFRDSDDSRDSRDNRIGSGDKPGDSRGYRGGSSSHSSSEFMRKGVAQPGDKPWFCYWNSTILEGFLYVNLTSNAASWNFGNSQSSTSGGPAPTATYKYVDDKQPSASATTTYGSSVPTSSMSGSPSSGPSQQFYIPPPFPKVLKIEERRIPRDAQTVQPYCVQQIIDAYGVAHPRLESTGQPVTIYLNETDPTVVSQLEGRSSAHNILRSRHQLSERQSAPSCGCVWLWT